jgi:hypothetical protein
VARPNGKKQNENEVIFSRRAASQYCSNEFHLSNKFVKNKFKVGENFQECVDHSEISRIQLGIPHTSGYAAVHM